MAKKNEPQPDLPAFAFVGLAQIKHLNIRKEGPEDDKVLAVDCKLEGDAPASLCDYFDAGLRAFFWDESESGLIARNVMLEPVGFSNVIEECAVEIEGLRFTGTKLKGFKLRPKDGGVVVLTFSASFYPNDDEAGELASKLSDDVSVSAKPQPSLFEAGKQ